MLTLILVGVALCQVVKIHRGSKGFGVKITLNITLKKKTLQSFEKSVAVYNSRWHNFQKRIRYFSNTIVRHSNLEASTL